LTGLQLGLPLHDRAHLHYHPHPNALSLHHIAATMKLHRRYRRPSPTPAILLVPIHPRQILVPYSIHSPQSDLREPLFAPSNRLFLSTRHGLQSLNLGVFDAHLHRGTLGVISHVATLSTYTFRPLLQLMKDMRLRQRSRPWTSWDELVVRELLSWPQAQAPVEDERFEVEDERFEVWHVHLHLEKHSLCIYDEGNMTVLTVLPPAAPLLPSLSALLMTKRRKENWRSAGR